MKATDRLAEGEEPEGAAPGGETREGRGPAGRVPPPPAAPGDVRLRMRIRRVLKPDDLEAFDRYAVEPGTTIESSQQWLADRGYPFSRDLVARYLRKLRGPRQRPQQFLKVDRMLTGADLEAYESKASDPNSSPDDVRRWLKERGYAVGLTAVRNHRKRFLTALHEVRQSARLAHALAQVAREHGTAALTEAR